MARTVKSLKHIAKCEACCLYQCQRPLLDQFRRADVMWVGLSAKIIDPETSPIPLAPETPTGSIIREIEEELSYLNFYKTNLVKCPPLDHGGKLRYPNEEEMSACFSNLEYEIERVQPSIVILLGLQVAKFFYSRMFDDKPVLPDDFGYEAKLVRGVSFLAVHHPSFINVYRKKRQGSYRASIEGVIESALSETNNFALTQNVTRPCHLVC
jgi:uracil-DNA glycosylase